MPRKGYVIFKGFRIFICIILFPLVVMFFLPIAFYFDIKRNFGNETIQSRTDDLGSKIKDSYLKFIRWE